MALLNTTPLSVGAAYPAHDSPQVDLLNVNKQSFKPDWWRFEILGGTSPGDDVLVSFDGQHDHLYLACGTVLGTGGSPVQNKSRQVWLKRAAGNAGPTTVYVMAGTLA